MSGPSPFRQDNPAYNRDDPDSLPPPPIQLCPVPPIMTTGFREASSFVVGGHSEAAAAGARPFSMTLPFEPALLQTSSTFQSQQQRSPGSYRRRAATAPTAIEEVHAQFPPSNTTTASRSSPSAFSRLASNSSQDVQSLDSTPNASSHRTSMMSPLPPQESHQAASSRSFPSLSHRDSESRPHQPSSTNGGIFFSDSQICGENQLRSNAVATATPSSAPLIPSPSPSLQVPFQGTPTNFVGLPSMISPTTMPVLSPSTFPSMAPYFLQMVPSSPLSTQSFGFLGQPLQQPQAPQQSTMPPQSLDAGGRDNMMSQQFAIPRRQSSAHVYPTPVSRQHRAASSPFLTGIPEQSPYPTPPWQQFGSPLGLPSSPSSLHAASQALPHTAPQAMNLQGIMSPTGSFGVPHPWAQGFPSFSPTQSPLPHPSMLTQSGYLQPTALVASQAFMLPSQQQQQQLQQQQQQPQYFSQQSQHYGQQHELQPLQQHAKHESSHYPSSVQPRKLRNSSSSYDPMAPPAGKRCASCHALNTPMWRDTEDGLVLCNACGLRFRKLGTICLQCHQVPRKWDLSGVYKMCMRCLQELPTPIEAAKRFAKTFQNLNKRQAANQGNAESKQSRGRGIDHNDVRHDDHEDDDDQAESTE